MLDKRKFYINGRWVDPSKKNDFEVINPSDESVCALISLGSKQILIQQFQLQEQHFLCGQTPLKKTGLPYWRAFIQYTKEEWMRWLN